VRKQVQSVEEQIQQKEQELKDVQMQDPPEMMIAEKPIRVELNALLEKEDLKWKQRAKENWL
jgi:hypothetical protein